VRDHEPDAGSDVTGAITNAVKDKDEWVINGSRCLSPMETLQST